VILKDGNQRCDVCGAVTMNGDRFAGFFMPPSINAKTGKHDGRFPGIARAGKPDELLQLHSCPTCTPKIKKATSTRDFSRLPSGPLKRILDEIVTRDQLGDLSWRSQS
jgi:hypothetical protein